MNAFGRWMEAHDLTLAEVARQMGVRTTQVWRCRQDDWWPVRRDIAMRIFTLTAGEVTPNDFLGEIDHAQKAGVVGIAAGDKQRSRRRGKGQIVRRQPPAA
jgi:hypothetical protein